MSSVAFASRVETQVAQVDDFLSATECEFVRRELKYVHWRSSHLISRSVEGDEQAFVSPRRVSETANQEWFTDELDAFVTEIEHRLSAISPFAATHLEYWQATRYPVGGGLDHHLDAGYWTNHPAGERRRTFLIYLTTPEEGGSTYFRVLDREIRAVAGRMIFWDNLFADGKPNHKTIHCGNSLKAGEKMTLVTWLRERAFRRNDQSFGDNG